MRDLTLKNTDTQSWSGYWSGVRHSGRLEEVIKLEEVNDVWSRWFASMQADTDIKTIVDLGAGNGALFRQIRKQPALNPELLIAVDCAADALNSVEQPALATVADFRSLPFLPGCADIVMSQFGIEYGGQEAVREAIPLVAPEGYLALVIHCRGSALFTESQANERVLQQFESARFVDSARELFRFYHRGEGGRKTSDEPAVADFRDAIQRVEALINGARDLPSGEFVRQIYAAVADVHDRAAHYTLSDLELWFDHLQTECLMYLDRMRHMIKSAFTAEDCGKLELELQNLGFTVIEISEVNARHAAPDTKVAYALLARRNEGPPEGGLDFPKM